MSKLTILLAAFLLFAVAASATQSSRSPRSCRQKLEQANLRPCEQHIWKQTFESQDEEQDMLRLRGARRSPQDWNLEQCCEQLQQLEEPRCQCEAFKEIMRSQSEQLEEREYNRRDMQELSQQLEEAILNLPKRCELPAQRRLQKCELNPNSY